LVRSALGELLCAPAQAAQERPPDFGSIHSSCRRSVARVQLFLSSVSDEFLSYRERLRHLLTRPDVEVKVQEDFIVSGDATLEMLDRYIQGCDGVIHLVGDMTGAMAKPPSVAAIASRYPDMGSRFPLAEFLQPDGPTLSYTQWEAWLALWHGKKLFFASPSEMAPRDEKYRRDPEQRALQHAHLARLRCVARNPGSKFTSQENLAAEVLRSFVLNLLVRAESYDQAQHVSLIELNRRVSIFLASSSELKEDRDAFDLYIRQENDDLIKQGIYVEIKRWENFLDAMSETCLQDDYDSAIRESDIFVCLFKTKAGKYTEHEFEVAHRSFSDLGKPRIYTYFKIAEVSTHQSSREALSSLWAFQDKLLGLGHYHTEYKSCEDLNLKFRRQLDKLLNEGRLTKGVSPYQENDTARRQATQQHAGHEKGNLSSLPSSNLPPAEKKSFSESDLVKELQITQEMQQMGAIDKDNAIILQSLKISQIRILRSSNS
jgi:hypothetical protein